MTELTQEICREFLDYNPDTGLLFWKPRDRKWFASDSQFKRWRTCQAGKEAFTSVGGHGYRQADMLGKVWLVHRIIWLYQTGEWPDQVDHINGIRTDNRWANLRSVPRSENMKNQKRPKDNTSGVIGVCWNRQKNKWMARINIGRKAIHLGLYEKLEDATKARKAAERQYSFHENHGRTAC